MNAGGRYFGFVNGGSLPAALAANWLAGAWDQNAGPSVASRWAPPSRRSASGGSWTCSGSRRPPGGGLVTGATMANFAGLAAARHALLQRQGWDVERDGMFGAPPLTVVVGDEVHVSVLKALSLLGLGRERVVRVPTDAQGRLRADQLPPLSRTTIVCIQAGNVNTGALDPAAGDLRPRARGRELGARGRGVRPLGGGGAGAPSPRGGPRARRFVGHRLPQVAQRPLRLRRRPGARPARPRAAMSASAATYLAQGAERHPFRYTPEMSRRARGVEVWAALRSLGRAGLAELIERTCRHATRFADGLRAAGYAVLNDVVLNQVLVSFGDAETTNRVIAAIQEDGTCWCSGTVWQGRRGDADQRLRRGPPRRTTSSRASPRCSARRDGSRAPAGTASRRTPRRRAEPPSRRGRGGCRSRRTVPP